MVSFVILLIARTARIACADRRTYRHTHETTTVTLAAHARRGLMSKNAYWTVSRAIRVFNVWRRARILAVYYFTHTFCVLCQNVGSANQIAELLISRVIKMYEAQRAPTKNVCATIDKRLSTVLRCMHAVLTWLTDPWLTPKLESARQ